MGAYRHAAVWDLKAEKVVAVFQQVGWGNTTIYSPAVDRFFFASRSTEDPLGTEPAIGIYTGSPVRFLTSVSAGSLGGASVAFDETNRMVYAQDIREGMEGLMSFPLP